MKKKHWKCIGIAAVVLLFLIYLAAANFLVSAALVPSTMEKLDAFPESQKTAWKRWYRRMI